MTRALDETRRDWRHERTSARPLLRIWIDARYAVAMCGVVARTTRSDLTRPSTWTTLGAAVALGALGSLVLLAPRALQAKPLYVETITWASLQLLVVPSMLVISLPVAWALMASWKPERMRTPGTVLLATMVAVSMAGWWSPLGNRIFRYEMLRAANEAGPAVATLQHGLPEVTMPALLQLAGSSDPRARNARLTAIKRASLMLTVPVAVGVGLRVRRLAPGPHRVWPAAVVSTLAVAAVFPVSSVLSRGLWVAWNRATPLPPVVESVGAASVLFVALLELIVLCCWAGRPGRADARA